MRFVEARPGFVRATLPFEGNTNHLGTIYAGAIFTLAEVLGGALHLATFDRDRYYPLVRSLTIDFKAPGRGPLSASASLDAAAIAQIAADAEAKGKAAFVLTVEVVGEDGTLVATTRGDYQIRRNGT